MKSHGLLSVLRSNRWLRRAGRYLMVAMATVLVCVIALYAVARVYWPSVATYQLDLEAMLTTMAQHTVRLGRVEPYWDGLNPGVRVWGATVYGDDQRSPSVRIAQVQGTIALLPLLWGQVELGRLVLVRPALTLERAADGRIGVSGMSPASRSAGEGGIAWLMQQPRIVIQGAELRWVDARDPGAPLTLTQVDIQLRNSGERHRVAASASFPRNICGECALSFDITGNPLAGSWAGEISLRTRALDVHALPLVLRERLPEDVRGQFDTQLRSDWDDGRARAVRGEISVKGLRAPLGEQRRALALRELSGAVDWRANDDGWRLDLAQLQLALTQRAWSAGRVRIVKDGADHSLEVQRVALDDVTAFVATLPLESPWLQRWNELRPSGTLENVEIRAKGTSQALPEAFKVSARLVDVAVAAHERLPGLRGVSGRVAFDADAGELDLEANNFALDLPSVFRAPLQAQRASARLRWHKTESAWRISGTDLRVRGEDGNASGSLTLELPYDRAVSPVLKLRVDFRDGNGAYAARYYPVHHLPARTLEWMESAIVGGRVVAGHLIYDGPTREFPFERGQGRFEIRAKVQDGVYRYLRGWAPLTQVEADVAVDGANVRVTGSGRVGALQVRKVIAQVRRDEGAAERTAYMQGEIEGPIAETLRILQAVDSPKAKTWQPVVRAVASAAGNGVLDLAVRAPLPKEIENSFLAVYRLQDAVLRLDSGAGIEAANGVIRFNEKGLRESNLQGRLFGGPINLYAVRTGEDLRVQAGGRFQMAELLRGRRALAERVSGGLDWSLVWQNQASGPQVRVDADLRAVRSRLPAPLTKTDATSLERVTLITEQSRPDALTFALSAGTALNGKIAFARADEGGWRFQKGRIEVGKTTVARLPQRDGLELGLNLEALDVDGWLSLLDQSAQQASADVLVALSADIKRLQLGNRQWGRVFVNTVRRGDGEWRTVVDGDALAGEGSVVLAAKSAPRIHLDLAYLRLPERLDVESPSESPVEAQPPDPRRFPAVELRARSFEYKQRKLGELDFGATPYEQGWRIERANLVRPEMNLVTQGTWRVSGERQFSELGLQFDSENMGATLDAFGVEGQMANGKVSVRTNLSWPGSPLRPTLAGLNGNIEVTAEKGQFLKFDPGAARLFGLLDLRSIGRYLTLDFRPAFGKGFVFDAIHGTIFLENGNARTNNLLVKGPSLNLGVDGRVGLASEDYDLVLQASPRISDTLTLTSWGLFGPAAAAAVLTLQRLFKRQIAEGTRVTYIVKGSWDSPSVTKLGKPRVDDAAPSPTP